MQKCFLVLSLGLIKVMLQDKEAVRNGKALSSWSFWRVVEWKIALVPSKFCSGVSGCVNGDLSIFSKEPSCHSTPSPIATSKGFVSGQRGALPVPISNCHITRGSVSLCTQGPEDGPFTTAQEGQTSRLFSVHVSHTEQPICCLLGHVDTSAV